MDGWSFFVRISYIGSPFFCLHGEVSDSRYSAGLFSTCKCNFYISILANHHSYLPDQSEFRVRNIIAAVLRHICVALPSMPSPARVKTQWELLGPSCVDHSLVVDGVFDYVIEQRMCVLFYIFFGASIYHSLQKNTPSFLLLLPKKSLRSAIWVNTTDEPMRRQLPCWTTTRKCQCHESSGHMNSQCFHTRNLDEIIYAISSGITWRIFCADCRLRTIRAIGTKGFVPSNFGTITEKYNQAILSLTNTILRRDQ